MIRQTTLILAMALLAACSGEQAETEKREQAREYFRNTNTILAVNEDIVSFPAVNKPETDRPEANPDRNAYFGDLHVHTTLSFDAIAFGTTATPADAYRYAQGEAIRHPSGFDVQLSQPLDFYEVTDHAIFLGLISEASDTSSSVARYEFTKPYHNINESVDGGILDLNARSKVFSGFVSDVVANLLDGTIDETVVNEISQSAWAKTINAANDAYEPGKFTTFVGYEFTPSTAEREALHRNVIFRGTERFPAQPFSRFNSINPEGLWDWMDKLRQEGVESLSIPHNSNGSNGKMFNLVDYAGNPLDAAYADLRMRNEPLVEISQVKGTSDTHPALSPNDEWADFEIMPFRIASDLTSQTEGSYVREALMNGLEFQEKKDFNPFKFGIVSASDTHNATYAGDEDNYWSKVGIVDDDPVERGSVPLPEPREDGNLYADTYFNTWSAAGLAAVWAEENTREAIYNAFRRKETFGTSGPRIKVRFFAGADLPGLEQEDVFRKAYDAGVPMGGELQIEGDTSPEFLIWASRDAHSAPLQRLQVIKANVREGKTVEKVYDVACSDGASVDPDTHRCPDNGATVNLEDCSISTDVGSAELKALWTDPDFDANELSLYYVRVLENPVCRWSTWDAIRAGVAPREDLHATIQERAWTSPIWLQP